MNTILLGRDPAVVLWPLLDVAARWADKMSELIGEMLQSAFWQDAGWGCTSASVSSRLTAARFGLSSEEGKGSQFNISLLSGA